MTFLDRRVGLGRVHRRRVVRMTILLVGRKFG
jgi:hypothetical protein